MSVDPQFAALPVVGSAAVSATADTSYTAPTHTVALLGGQGPRQVVDGVLNSTTTVTSSTINAGTGDIGRPISAIGIPNGTVISAVAALVGATSITLSQPATATASGVTLTLGGGVGTLIQEVDVVGNGTTVAGVINTFLEDPAGAFHIHDSFIVTAVTPSTTLAAFRLQRPYTGLWLPPGWNYVASSWAASQIASVVANGLNA